MDAQISEDIGERGNNEGLMLKKIWTARNQFENPDVNIRNDFTGRRKIKSGVFNYSVEVFWISTKKTESRAWNRGLEAGAKATIFRCYPEGDQGLSVGSLKNN